MEASPSEPLYPDNLGDLYRDLKRYEDAEHWYRKALGIDAGYAAAYNGLGLLFKELKRYDEAETQFRKAMEASPSEPVYPDNLGDLYRDLKRYEDAEHWYRKALEISEDDAYYLNGFAWFLYEWERQLDEAEQKAKRAVEIAPDASYSSHSCSDPVEASRVGCSPRIDFILVACGWTGVRRGQLRIRGGYV